MGIEHQPVKYTAGSNQLTRWAVWMLIYFKSQCFHVDVQVLKGLKAPSIIQYRVFFHIQRQPNVIKLWEILLLDMGPHQDLNSTECSPKRNTKHHHRHHQNHQNQIPSKSHQNPLSPPTYITRPYFIHTPKKNHRLCANGPVEASRCNAVTTRSFDSVVTKVSTPSDAPRFLPYKKPTKYGE